MDKRAVCLWLGIWGTAAVAQPVTLENDACRIEIAPDGTLAAFLDVADGADYASAGGPIASVTVGGVVHPANRASAEEGRIRIGFAETDVEFQLAVEPHPGWFRLEVVEVTGGPVESLWFFDAALSLRGRLEEPFAACMLALNLETNVPELPGPNSRLRAGCVARFGLVGAAAALIAGPTGAMRSAMQDAVSSSPDLPHSPLGGPWAWDAPETRSSYVFNFDGVTLDTVDEWIARAQSLGFTQIQFHGGSSFRFGDCALSPERYPNGRADLKAVIDRLHAAGMIAGMQPYAFFIDKRCEWVTPTPDPGLASDAVFTLREDLAAEATTIAVLEPTDGVSTITGFFVRNSVTLRIEDELVVFSGVDAAGRGFTQCQRGAFGTTPAAHPAGAKAYHLKECFGLFAPDPASDLFDRVAARNAEFCGECGFDAIYFDALDGEDVLGGAEDAWRHGSRYVFEVWERLPRPVMVEMSTFHHHLWFVRSRLGAWDHPNRSYKRFVDLHLESNAANDRMFLPSVLGWWAFKSWTGPLAEPTHPDDIEYLCCKAIGHASGLAMVGYEPSHPGQQRLAEVMRRYEGLRLSGDVPDDVRRQLAEPGAEFTLTEDGHFRRAAYLPHKVESAEAWSSVWAVRNPYNAQPASFRIEILSGVEASDVTAAPQLLDAGSAAEFSERGAAEGVEFDLSASDARTPSGDPTVRLSARNATESSSGSWAYATRTFDPPLDLSGREAVGVWVHGDGGGELLNLQFRSPDHITSGIGDHYVTVDFEGWRFIELVEPEGEAWQRHTWPYGHAYSIFRENVHYPSVNRFSVWLNEIPPAGSSEALLGPVAALATVSNSASDIVVTVDGRELALPGALPTGSVMECRGPEDCKAYGPDGTLLYEVQPQGEWPVLPAGEARAAFRCSVNGARTPRARITFRALGPIVGP